MSSFACDSGDDSGDETRSKSPPPQAANEQLRLWRQNYERYTFCMSKTTRRSKQDDMDQALTPGAHLTDKKPVALPQNAPFEILNNEGVLLNKGVLLEYTEGMVIGKANIPNDADRMSALEARMSVANLGKKPHSPVQAVCQKVGLTDVQAVQALSLIESNTNVLDEMGFVPTAAAHALSRSNGNLQAAIEMLLRNEM